MCLEELDRVSDTHLHRDVNIYKNVNSKHNVYQSQY